MVNVISYDGVTYYGFHAVVISFLSAILAFARVIYKQNKAVLEKLEQIIKEDKKMSMSIQDLDTALQQEVLDVQGVANGLASLTASDTKAFADLEAKAGQGVDVTSEVATLSSNHTVLAAAAQALATALAASNAADATTQTAPAPSGV